MEERGFCTRSKHSSINIPQNSYFFTERCSEIFTFIIKNEIMLPYGVSTIQFKKMILRKDEGH